VQEDPRLIIDLVTVLAAAAAGGLLAALLRQPILLGYLIAGIAIGPAGLGLIKELVQVETLGAGRNAGAVWGCFFAVCPGC